MLNIIYRICDHRNGRTKIPQINKRQCFLNFIEVFGARNLVVVADNTSQQTIDLLGRFTKFIEKTTLGNSGSFLYAMDIAIQFPEDEPVYIVEDDYLHLPKARKCLLEGLEQADYVSLYDHADKYMAKSPNPLVTGGGENTKVILTKSTHWKFTNSTTMTFAAKAGILKADQQIFRHYCADKIPLDYFIFRKLAENGRTIITPIPGQSTHCDEYPSPFIFDHPIPIRNITDKPAEEASVHATVNS